MSGWYSTSELPPWADFWDDEWTPRSSTPGLDLESQTGPGETVTNIAAVGCMDASAVAGTITEYWSTSSPSPSCSTLSQDVKAAVEEIDSIVSELWRTALPLSSTFSNDNPQLSGAEISNAFSTNPPNTDSQNAIHTSSALSENQKSNGNDLSRITMVGMVDHTNENEAKDGKPKHKCDKCDKCYIWLNDLVKHKKIHSGIIRYTAIKINYRQTIRYKGLFKETTILIK